MYLDTCITCLNDDDVDMKVTELDNPALSPITHQTQYLVEAGSHTSPSTRFRNFKVAARTFKYFMDVSNIFPAAVLPDLPGLGALELLHLLWLADHAALLGDRHLGRVQGQHRHQRAPGGGRI